MVEVNITCQTSSRNGKFRREVACERCGLYTLCVLAGLYDPDHTRLDRIVTRRQPLAKRGQLFREGEPFRGVYAVKSGAFKAFSTSGANKPQVSCFYLPGELMGLEAIHGGYHTYSVEALEPSQVCVLSFENVPQLKARMATFQEELVRGLSGQLAQLHRSVSHARSACKEARLAAFLLDLSARYAERGLPAWEFRIPMTRYDIASFLGLAVETVCRLFQGFQKRGVLVARGKYTRLCDLNVLRELVES